MIKSILTINYIFSQNNNNKKKNRFKTDSRRHLAINSKWENRSNSIFSQETIFWLLLGRFPAKNTAFHSNKKPSKSGIPERFQNNWTYRAIINLQNDDSWNILR